MNNIMDKLSLRYTPWKKKIAANENFDNMYCSEEEKCAMEPEPSEQEV